MQDRHDSVSVQAPVAGDLNDLLGGTPAGSALDLGIRLTTFPDRNARVKDEKQLTLREFAEIIRDTRGADKRALPLVRLSTFGDVRSVNNCLRHGANEEFIFGIIAEHDAETVPMPQAIEWAREAGVAGIAFPTSSSTAAKPRWRFLMPLSEPLDAQNEKPAYDDLAGRAQTIFRGSLAKTELYATALSFHFGDSGQDGFEVIAVDGAALDELPHIESTPRPPRVKIDRQDDNAPWPVDDDFVRAVLGHIPNDVALSSITDKEAREAAGYSGIFSKVGFGLWRQYRDNPDMGLVLFQEWATRNPDYNRRETSSRWKSLSNGGQGGRYTLKALVDEAEKHGFVARDHVDFSDEFEELPAARLPVPYAAGTSLTDILSDSLSVQPTSILRPAPKPEWSSLLEYTAEGEVKSTLHNIKVIVANDIRLANILAFNEFIGKNVRTDAPFHIIKKRASAKDPVNFTGHHWKHSDGVNGEPFADIHSHDIRSALEAPKSQGGYGIKVSDRDLAAAVDLAARGRVFHPVRDFLGGLCWDGKDRVERLFIDYLGCVDNPYHRDTARLFLVAAVSRVFEPGHKFDYVPIIEGEQGVLKSSFLKILVGGRWFSDTRVDWTDPKSVIEQTGGKWLMEIRELSDMARAEVADFKGSVTQTEDKARQAYDRYSAVVPRQFVMAGTTNEKTYLIDPTGNRRFWPIESRVAAIDTDRLAAEREQIWAEAAAIYRQMRAEKPDGDLRLTLEGEAAATAKRLQEGRRRESSVDLLVGEIERWLNQPAPASGDDMDDSPLVLRTEVCAAAVWREMMHNPVGARPKNGDMVEIGKALARIGWEQVNDGKQITTERYGRQRVYRRPVV